MTGWSLATLTSHATDSSYRKNKASVLLGFQCAVRVAAACSVLHIQCLIRGRAGGCATGIDGLAKQVARPSQGCRAERGPCMQVNPRSTWQTSHRRILVCLTTAGWQNSATISPTYMLREWLISTRQQCGGSEHDICWGDACKCVERWTWLLQSGSRSLTHLGRTN